MKSIHFANITKLFALLLLVVFSACTETNDPVPADPDQQNPTNGLPDFGDSDDDNDSDDDDDDPFGDDDDDSDDDGNTGSGTIGIISSEACDYEFENYLGTEAESQPNDAGAYPMVFYYGDEDAANDTDGNDDIDGVITGIAFNAAAAGVIEPGEYTYSVGSENAEEFAYVMIFDHARIYVVSEAQIQVVTTNNSDIYGIVFEGSAVEVENVNGEIEIVSNPFDIEGQFLAPASSANARQDRWGKRKLPHAGFDFSALSF